MPIELTLLAPVAFAGREIRGARLYGLLALLATDLRTGCGRSRLIEGLWPEEQPGDPAKALQVLVTRLRSQLGPDVVVRTAAGYRLALAEDQVDTSAALLSMSACAQHARAGDHSTALWHAEAGLALWHDAEDADPGLRDPLSMLRTEREATRRALFRARALALSRLDRCGEAIVPLLDVVSEWPRDEEALLELLRCEAATAGPSAALERYEAYRRTLREELGTDPGPALQAGYQQLLKGEKPPVRHGVAHEPNPLLGRDGDVAAVRGLLATARVTSIVGPGGLGKTRLASAVSRGARQRLVHFIPLAGVVADDDVALEVASALGVAATARSRAVGPAGVVSGIVEALGSGPVLVVLDNCEHVVGGVADLVGALVARTKDVRVLTTSRRPLELSSESVYLLPELDLATAAELFRQRASAARPNIKLPADTITELCRHLDGLPLAVELAAARVRVMSVTEIAQRLGDRFALLRSSTRDAPERHRTLQSVVEWSWHLLDAESQDAMRTLSVFAAGFTAEAAAHLIGDDTVLEHLVGQSLLKAEETAIGSRFRMLETIREFGLRELVTSGQAGQAEMRLLAWARAFALAHYGTAFGPGYEAGVERIFYELDNLVSALRQSVDRKDEATMAAVAAALASYWTLASDYGRMASLASDMAPYLPHFRPEDPELIEATRTVAALCLLNTLSVQVPGSAPLQVVLRQLPTAPPDTWVRALAIVLNTRDPAEIIELGESDQPLLAGLASAFASYIWEQRGDLERALATAERMVPAFERQDTAWMLAVAHGRVGQLSSSLDRGEQARRHIRAALEAMGTWPDVIGLRWGMVTASLQTGEIDEAAYWLEQAELNLAGGARRQTSYQLGLRAEILLARGQIEAGLRMWRRAADPSMADEDPLFRTDPLGMAPWVLEAQAAAVVAHAEYDRLDLVAELVDGIPERLRALLEHPALQRPAGSSPAAAASRRRSLPAARYQVDIPLCGVMLVALGMADIGRGDTAGVRSIALAERIGYPRAFQPTLSASRIRRAAEHAGKPAYEDAVSSYAGLDDEALRAAAMTTVTDRG